MLPGFFRFSREKFMLIQGRKQVRQALKQVNEAVRTVVERRNPEAPPEFFTDIHRVILATQELGINEMKIYLIYKELGESFQILMKAALEDAQKKELEQAEPHPEFAKADLAVEPGTEGSTGEVPYPSRLILM